MWGKLGGPPLDWGRWGIWKGYSGLTWGGAAPYGGMEVRADALACLKACWGHPGRVWLGLKGL